MNLDLIPLSPELAANVAQGYRPEALANVLLSGFVQEIATAHVSLYQKSGAVPPWIAYLACNPEAGGLVGVCRFKNRPENGQVEIAYFTFPEHEGRGYGGEMASVLVEIAFREASLLQIAAHTKPTHSVSTRILERLGFRMIGLVESPESSMVWRWILQRYG
jgi:ribosomal-protein-alanine N-acetyltransferase